MTALVLKDICKSFGEVEVLKNINLTVEEGEFVVFIGPSGCGKSTLLRVISGLEDASRGSVEIGGKSVTQIPPAKRGIAMVFQSYALYPHLTVRGNMELGLKQAKHPKEVIAARVDKASQMLNLENYLERRPSELSGGQRQRVAIGRAIVREPKLFLFDEPLSNLDAALRMNTRIEIANLHSALGASMVYVTHDQTEAMTLADKIVVLRNGRVEQIGKPLDLYNNPLNKFVAGFLGSPSMNFISGDTLGQGADVTIGIRPEHLQIREDGRINARVTLVENLGGDTNVLLECDGSQMMTMRLFGQNDIAVGSVLRLDFEADKGFAFDPAGKRIAFPA